MINHAKEGVPAYWRYCIFPDTTLDELVSRRPQSRHELSTVTGLGDVRLQKYGIHVLNIIGAHEPPARKTKRSRAEESEGPAGGRRTGCSRCGRTNHSLSSCYVSTDSNGRPLAD
jgi:hypothetical protein